MRMVMDSHGRLKSGAVVPIQSETIQSRILGMRGIPVMLDRDLAELYGVPVKRLNEQVRRNIERFPEPFMFQLTAGEVADLKSQIATSSEGDALGRLKSQIATSSWGGVRKPPKVFSEQGVFFDGQLWDARSLAEKLIGRAKKTILLIDNWIGPGTLDVLAKKRVGVAVDVVTSEHRDCRGTPRQTLASSDIADFNAQYPSVTVRYNEHFHDRFLILDDKELYLIGASLKDLGKKCFAFTRLDSASIPDIKARI